MKAARPKLKRFQSITPHSRAILARCLLPPDRYDPQTANGQTPMRLLPSDPCLKT